MGNRAFHDPSEFPFVPALEAAFRAIRAELRALGDAAFVECPDSLTTRADGYDETGWLYYALHGEGAPEEHRERCPATSRACAAVPNMQNAGFSRFRPGTHLFPHRGELTGVLRCHLPIVVPRDGSGEGSTAGLRVAGETRRWKPGRCLVFDDTHEHDAWNHGDEDRVVLLVTFRP